MQELTITPSTVILLLVILALAALAVRRLFKRGMCDCGDHCEGCSHRKGAPSGGAFAGTGTSGGACAHCSAADDMVKRMREAANR